MEQVVQDPLRPVAPGDVGDIALSAQESDAWLVQWINLQIVLPWTPAELGTGKVPVERGRCVPLHTQDRVQVERVRARYVAVGWRVAIEVWGTELALRFWKGAR